MAACSYQVIARYDDCSFGCRARCTDDIRRRQREALCKSRFRMKTLQMLQNRKSLTQYIGADYHHDGYQDTTTFDIVDYPSYNLNNHALPEDSWGLGWGSSSRSDAPSPTLSCHSDVSVHSFCSVDCQNDIYEAILKEPTMQIDRRNKNLKSRKQQLKLRKLSHLNHYDLNRTRQDFETLKMYSLRNQDPQITNNLVRSGWKVLANAIQAPDSDLSHECLKLVVHLVSNRSIEIETVLYILQQGLIFSLRDSMSGYSNHQVYVVELLIKIMKTEPRSIPYIVELMSNTQVLRAIEDSFCMGTKEEAQIAFELYEYLFETLLSQLVNGCKQNPIIPQIVLQTGITDKILESYSPMMSLKRIVNPGLIEPVVTRYFSQVNLHEEKSLGTAIRLLANCLKFTYLQNISPLRDTSWVSEVLFQFNQQNFEQSLVRLVESSNQYSQQVQIQLKQFLHFHQNFNNMISPSLNEPMCQYSSREN